jgi:hypothetical protein
MQQRSVPLYAAISAIVTRRSTRAKNARVLHCVTPLRVTRRVPTAPLAAPFGQAWVVGQPVGWLTIQAFRWGNIKTKNRNGPQAPRKVSAQGVQRPSTK